MPNEINPDSRLEVKVRSRTSEEIDNLVWCKFEEYIEEELNQGGIVQFLNSLSEENRKKLMGSLVSIISTTCDYRKNKAFVNGIDWSAIVWEES